MNEGEFVLFRCESEHALWRLHRTIKEHPADAHEAYFTANGENYRIRIERIPGDSSTGRKGEHEQS